MKENKMNKQEPASKIMNDLIKMLIVKQDDQATQIKELSEKIEQLEIKVEYLELEAGVITVNT